MSDVTFGTWSVAASPLTIEYSLVVIEEIRHEVAEGFQKLSRGGIEVGGVLYGVHVGHSVRIMAIRPIACEHASGPAFRPSEKDRAALRDQMRQDLADPRLEGLVCLGWYVSHTRTEISLTESDQELFDSFFGELWQVTLVVRPGRGGSMRAGFFVREPDRTVNGSQSYLEFSFPDRLAAFDLRPEHRPDARGDHHRGDMRGSFAGRERERHSTDRQTERRSAPRLVNPIPAPAPEVVIHDVGSAGVPSPLAAAPSSLLGSRNPSSIPSLFDAAPAPQAQGLSKKWFWVVASLIGIAALAVAGSRLLLPGPANEGIALNVLERDGQLDIQWNREAPPVSKAVRGSIEITDGTQTQTVPLKVSDLAAGKFSYKRNTGDIQVRMIAEGADGAKVSAASRFLGPPPSKGNEEEVKTLQQRRGELEAEVQRLKQSNNQQAERIQQLERTLKILQTRPGN